MSRRPVAYAAVVLAGQEQKGASTDSLGRFRIERVKPGIWRLAVSSVGYKSLTTRIHGLGRHALYRSRAGGGCRAAGGRDGPSVAVPRHGGESRKFEGDRPAGDREKPRLEPRRVAHRALVSRRGLLARGVSQRFDRARWRACGEQVLHGRDRNPEHQPFRHAGGDGRSGEHRQRRPRARNQFLYGSLSRRPGRGVEFRAGLQAPRRAMPKSRPSKRRWAPRKWG